MARVTIEDCLSFVKNRFDLVHLAAKKARVLSEFAGDDHNTKHTVQALKEIADGNLSSNDNSLDIAEA